MGPWLWLMGEIFSRGSCNLFTVIVLIVLIVMILLIVFVHTRVAIIAWNYLAC